MTKVQTKFQLSRGLGEQDFKTISHMHSVIGILAARVLPSGNELFIEYDASRLTPNEVRGTLEENGLPLK